MQTGAEVIHDGLWSLSHKKRFRRPDSFRPGHLKFTRDLKQAMADAVLVQENGRERRDFKIRAARR